MELSLKKPLLTLTNLRCVRGDRCLFENFSLQAFPGQIKQIVAPNGAGKTSLLRIISGLREADEGEVYWQKPGDFHYLGHIPAIKNALTILENITLSFNQDRMDKTKIAELLVAFDLIEQRNLLAAKLSQGQKQRLALVKLCLMKATTWILDEPFAALDNDGIAFLEQIFAKKIAQGGMIILATHQAITQLPTDTVQLIGDKTPCSA